MSRRASIYLFVAALATGAAVLTPCAAAAQGAQQVGPPSATPPGPSRPATPPTPAGPTPAVVPPDSAVALCIDGTFVKEPGTAADCAGRGGLRVAMPPRATPPARQVTPSFAIRPALIEQAPPAGATVRCKDGTYLTIAPSPTVCDARGGVAALFPSKPAPPRRS